MVYRIVDIDGVRVENNRLYVNPGYTISGTLVVDENDRLLVDTGVTISGGLMEVHDANIQDIVDGNSQVQSVMFGTKTHLGVSNPDTYHNLKVSGPENSDLSVSSMKLEEQLKIVIDELLKINIHLNSITGERL